MAPAILLTLLAFAPSARAAASADGSFAVEAPPGWAEAKPKSGLLIQLSPPEGKGGLTLAPAPPEIADEASARQAIERTAPGLAQKFKTGFGSPRILETPHPGRMVFVEAPVGTRTYVLGFHEVGGRWFRVDALAADASKAANHVLSSMRPHRPAGDAPRLRPDQAAPADGRFVVAVPKGWKVQPTSDDGEVFLVAPSGDEIRVGYDPSVREAPQAEGRVSQVSGQTGGDWGVKFSAPSEMPVAGRTFKFAGGHADGELVDSALVGLYKNGSMYFLVRVRARSTRPLDLAQKILETFRLKGEEVAPASSPSAASATPQEDPAAKIKAPKSSGSSEGWPWLMMFVMALVPIGLIAAVSFASFVKKQQGQ